METTRWKVGSAGDNSHGETFWLGSSETEAWHRYRGATALNRLRKKHTEIYLAWFDNDRGRWNIACSEWVEHA